MKRKQTGYQNSTYCNDQLLFLLSVGEKLM